MMKRINILCVLMLFAALQSVYAGQPIRLTLQEQTFEPLGDSRPHKVDVRVVCATNANLPLMVREHTFREDVPLLVCHGDRRRSYGKADGVYCG